MMVHVLVVDDEELALFTMREILEDAGYTVETAGDGAAGLAHQRSGAFDLVITDMVMPGKEGCQMIEEIRETNQSIPIIAISGGARVRNVDFLVLAKQFGANAVLRKPFSEKELMAAVAGCLGTMEK